MGISPKKVNWQEIISKLAHRESIIVTKVQSTAVVKAARKLGLGYVSKPTQKDPNRYRVYIYKDPSDRSWVTYRHRSHKDCASRGNWDVDINNLPIPQSAYSGNFSSKEK